jgi:ABC-type polysaccharide/polyol phosphate export permease
MQHAINVILTLLFFFTPVIWNADQLSEANKIILVDTNIVYHYIEFFRSSLLAGYPETKTFLVVIISTLILLMTSLYVSKKFSKKLVFWLI